MYRWGCSEVGYHAGLSSRKSRVQVPSLPFPKMLRYFGCCRFSIVKMAWVLSVRAVLSFSGSSADGSALGSGPRGPRFNSGLPEVAVCTSSGGEKMCFFSQTAWQKFNNLVAFDRCYEGNTRRSPFCWLRSIKLCKFLHKGLTKWEEKG